MGCLAEVSKGGTMQRRTRRVLGAVAVTMIVATACAGPAITSPASVAPSAEPSPRLTVAPTAWPTTVPSPSPTPFARWSFFSAVPAPDGPGTLLLLHRSWGDEGRRTPLLVVLADGRVVAMRWPEEGEASMARRRLTEAGIDQVRAELAAVGLFDRDRKRQMIEPWPAGGAGDQLQVRLGSTTVSVSRNLAPSEYYEPSAAWNRFDALVEELRAPDRWLAEDLWRDTRWTPFHAEAFCLRLDSSWTEPGSQWLDSAELDVPDGILPLASFGAQGINAGTRFGSLDAEDTYRLAAAVANLANARAIPRSGGDQIPLDAGAARAWFGTVRDAGVDWSVYVEALMPQAECVDV